MPLRLYYSAETQQTQENVESKGEEKLSRYNKEKSSETNGFRGFLVRVTGFEPAA